MTQIKERKAEVAQLENKLFQREQNIDRRDGQLSTKEALLDEKSETLSRRLKDCDKKEAQLQEKIDSIIDELQKVASMSIQEAKDELFARVESKMSQEIAVYIKNKEDEANETLKGAVDYDGGDRIYKMKSDEINKERRNE